MTGGHVQGDLLAPEDVVSLLLDDAQLEQKLREVPSQVGIKYGWFSFLFKKLAHVWVAYELLIFFLCFCHSFERRET